MKTYICYKILLRCPCCEKEIEVGSMDYYHNAIERRNKLRETFGKYRVKILKKIRKLIPNSKNKPIFEIG